MNKFMEQINNFRQQLSNGKSQIQIINDESMKK